MLALGACSEKSTNEHAVAPLSEPQHVLKKQVEALAQAKRLEQTMNEDF